jgi:ornithine carbamoyltransferase
MKKDLITIGDLTGEEVMEFLELSKSLKKSPFCKRNVFRNKTLALIFQKPSNRTRISFEVAMAHLGGYGLYLSPRELDMGVRESVKDVSCVISRYVDGIVARVFAHSDVVALAHYSDVPVINGLSDHAHPCQALSDVFTVMEKVKNFRKAKIAYIGDGNNVLNSLVVACAKVGISVGIATPEKYAPSEEVISEARTEALKTKARIEVSNDPFEAIKGADFVYTDVWVSMGQEEEKAQRLKDFQGFQVNAQLLRASGKDTYIMHCLPAHRGEEISDVIDGKNSVVYDQAENRMHVEKAILFKLLGKRR